MALIKKHWVILSIVLLSLLFHLTFLSSVPISTTNDQLHYHLDAQSFFYTGYDLTNSVSLLDIFLFKYPPQETVQAELPYLLDLLPLGLFGSSLTSAAFMSALFSAGIAIVLYFLGNIFGNKRLGYLAALLGAINPWIVVVGRSAYEAIPALFFYLLLLLLFYVLRGKKLLIIIPVLFLAFYSYIGTKLLFLPFLLACGIFSYFYIHKRKFLIEHLAIIISAIALAGFYLFQISNAEGASRVGDIFLPTDPRISQLVNTLRQDSMPFLFDSLLINKFSIYFLMVIENIFNTLSFTFFFLTGDYFFSLFRHGLFYIADAVFLFIGIGSFFKKNKATTIFFSSLLLISLLPHVLHNQKDAGQFSPHVTLFIGLLLLVIAHGISATISSFSNKKQIFVIGGILLIYLFSIINFIHIFFFQSPLSTGIYTPSRRLMSKYSIEAMTKTEKVVIHTDDARTDYKNFLFYNNLITKSTISEIKKMLQTNENVFSYKNIQFVSCGDPKEVAKDTTLVIGRICYKSLPLKSIEIPQLKDSGGTYTIYNDKVCKGINGQRYIKDLKLSDLAIEDLTSEQLCKKFLLSY
ncbi:MAG: glycosyltransferase family 39 protein [Candidatus Levybacteria bacterium]|nr:glycosyltransferase family 39 protein [Candidatus Levybacteria bacterium]